MQSRPNLQVPRAEVRSPVSRHGVLVNGQGHHDEMSREGLGWRCFIGKSGWSSAGQSLTAPMTIDQ